MRITVQSANSDPAGSLLLAMDNKQRPICSLWEDDLTDILSEEQVIERVKGKDNFDVPKQSLELIAISIFNTY